MSNVRSIFGFFKGLMRRTGIQSFGPLSLSRMPAASVTFDTAMAVPAFHACIRLLVSNMSTLPLTAYQEDDKGVRVTVDHDLWKLLSFRPNQYQTRVEFLDTMLLNYFTAGNAFAAVQRNAGGEIVSLLPLMAEDVQVELLRDGSIVYRHMTADGQEIRYFAPESMWHLKFYGNGVVGMAPMDYAKQALGIAIATQDRFSKLAASGGKTGGVLMVDATLTSKQRDEIREQYDEITDGKQEKLYVLQKGVDFKRTALTPQDMQLLETYRFQVQELCRMTGVPSILANDANVTAWGTGVKEIVGGWHRLELRPHAERIEASIVKNLMPQDDWGKIFIEFDFEALLRPDWKDRIEIYARAINTGQMTPNEARALEGLKELDGGDKLIANGGLEPVAFLTQPQQPAQPQQPQPAPQESNENGTRNPDAN